jgi:hypothetical protein
LLSILSHRILPLRKASLKLADIPVFSGVGGGLTQGARSTYMSMFAEAQGSLGVVLNAPTPVDTVREVCQVVDIPVISTVASKYAEIGEKLEAGVSVINISAGKETAETVRYFREKYPELPIIATGGSEEKTILRRSKRANAITYTPPSNGELFSRKMEKYREAEKKNKKKITDKSIFSEKSRSRMKNPASFCLNQIFRNLVRRQCKKVLFFYAVFLIKRSGFLSLLLNYFFAGFP